MTVTVQEGVVTLGGTVEEHSTIPIVEHLCLFVDGVVSVDQYLEYAVEDLPPDSARDTDDRRALRPWDGKSRPLLAAPDRAVHGRQPLLRILAMTLSVNFMKAPFASGQQGRTVPCGPRVVLPPADNAADAGTYRVRSRRNHETNAYRR
ncbi:BON domain-containing protein [Streptomyces sp. LN785]|uniref:BON domain-containing protein n=1 Tax=Streptomyces sp. LN785 TaxID=3112983 RepID=UPI0037200E6F